MKTKDTKFETRVNFYYPGTLFYTIHHEVVENENDALAYAKEKIKTNKNCFGFHLSTAHVITVDGKEIAIKNEQNGPRYLVGKFYSLKDLKKIPNQEKLIAKVKEAGVKGAVKCRTNNWQLFFKDDVILENVE